MSRFFFKPPTQQLRVKIFATPLINPLMTPKKLCNRLVNTFQMDTKSVMQENGKQRSNDLLNCGNQTLLIYINSVNNKSMGKRSSLVVAPSRKVLTPWTNQINIKRTRLDSKRTLRHTEQKTYSLIVFLCHFRNVCVFFVWISQQYWGQEAQKCRTGIWTIT